MDISVSKISTWDLETGMKTISNQCTEKWYYNFYQQRKNLNKQSQSYSMFILAMSETEELNTGFSVAN